MQLLNKPPISEAIKDGLSALYPDCTWMWVCGYNVPADQVMRLRPRISVDLLRLWGLSQRGSSKGVVVVVEHDDPIAEILEHTVSKLENWEIVVTGIPPLQNVGKVEINKTAKFALVYGELPEWFDPDMPVLERSIDLPSKVSIPLDTSNNHYSDYRAIVNYVRRWWTEPYVGLRIRDMIDLRPKGPNPGNSVNNV